jgi:hypothetical protein
MFYISLKGNLKDITSQVLDILRIPNETPTYKINPANNEYSAFKYENSTVYVNHSVKPVEHDRKKYAYYIDVSGAGAEVSVDTIIVENKLRKELNEWMLKKPLKFEEYTKYYFIAVKRMNKSLFKIVETQLIQDLRYYGLTDEGIFLDWSDPCGEGHTTDYQGGYLENYSDVFAIDKTGQIVADGWIEFIHGGGDNPLFVFWEFLALFKEGKRIKVKERTGIPEHIWKILPERTKELCAKQNEYDSQWHNDPLVTEWLKNK